MRNVARLTLDDEASALIDEARGTNEAYTVLCIAAGDEREIPMAQAIETCKRISANLPRELIEVEGSTG